VAQRTLVLTLPASQAASVRARLGAGPFEFRPVPHADFSARGEGTTATLYRSGKLVVQGPDPEAFAARWLGGAAASGERPEAPRAELGRAAHQDGAPSAASIGSDECGKGDYFGPLVVAAVRLEPGEAERLAGGEVRDSKALSDEQCQRLGGALRSQVAHAVVRLDPPDYNERYRPGKLNELLADLHAQAIGQLARPGIHVLVDKFADERLLQTRLAPLGVELEHSVRAESKSVAVAAASILAREEFLTALRELSERHAIDLHKGAGDPTDRAARRFVALHGSAALRQVAKLHFKNTQRVAAGGPRP
jgi:ribonuclease HIII